MGPGRRQPPWLGQSRAMAMEEVLAGLFLAASFRALVGIPARMRARRQARDEAALASNQARGARLPAFTGRRRAGGGARGLLRGLPRTLRRSVRDDLARLQRLRTQAGLFDGIRRLMRLWRSLHASLAILLVVALCAHIGVALYLGYGPSFWR